MAGALAGRARVVAQLILDLGMDPSPDHPISVEIRCDCLAVFPRGRILPLSVNTRFCVLSSGSARAQGVQTRWLAWCETHGVSLTFACPLWGLGEDGEVFLWAHNPPEPGMEE